VTAFLARVRVLLTAAPTWITTASAIVVLLSEQISTAFPDSTAVVGRWSLTVLAVLTAAANIVRRVAPVLPAERGLLPAGGAPGGQD
jgi:hypothetical protein